MRYKWAVTHEGREVLAGVTGDWETNLRGAIDAIFSEEVEESGYEDRDEYGFVIEPYTNEEVRNNEVD